MLEIIKQALALARAIVNVTPNTLDDKIIAAIEAILGNEVILQLLADLLDRWLGDPQLVMAADRVEQLLADLLDRWLGDPQLVMAADRVEVTAEQQAELDRVGIDLATILALIKLIKEIIDMFRK